MLRRNHLASNFALAPVFVSLVVHGALAASFVGGHSAGEARGFVAASDVLVEAQFELVPALTQEQQAVVANKEHTAARNAPAHVHPYPVAVDHNAHPHDPEALHPHVPSEVRSTQPLKAQAVNAASEDDHETPTFAIALGKPVGSAASFSVGVGSPERQTPSSGDAAGSSVPPEREIVFESDVSVPARLRASAAVIYPVAARAQGVETDVPVLLVVDVNGKVIRADVVTRAGYGFDEAALLAVKRYRFSPAQRAGKNVSVRMRWNVQFRLN
jgi:TonB family protein